MLFSPETLNAIAEKRDGKERRNPYAAGYGVKIPTDLWVLLDGETRYRKVYVACYSNSGTPYVIIKGKRFVINLATVEGGSAE